MSLSPAVRYVVHPSPIGDLFLASTDEGLLSVQTIDGGPAPTIESLARELHTLPDPAADATSQTAARQLDEYFSGERRTFTLTFDWRLVRGFTRSALLAVCEIPYGETAGYGEVAALAGSPRAARAVGTACARTPFTIVVPVHRVVRADGSIGEYGGSPERKEFLLRLESPTRFA